MPPSLDSIGAASDATSTDMAPPATPPLQSASTTSADMLAGVVAPPMSTTPTSHTISISVRQPDTTAFEPTLSGAIEIPTPDTTANGDAGADSMTALADDLEYTLTVGQALEWFAKARRKIPSERSVQRYCIDGQLAAQKIRTTYGSEWLINETSLAELIEAQPVISAAASVATGADMAPPESPILETLKIIAPDTTASGSASDAVVRTMAAPEGERRSIAEVLIENARLFAQVEGKDAIIEELKEDKNFLREEVREARKTRDDVKNIAERMLDTLKTMAIGRLASTPLRDEPLRPEFVEHTDQRSG